MINITSKITDKIVKNLWIGIWEIMNCRKIFFEQSGTLNSSGPGSTRTLCDSISAAGQMRDTHFNSYIGGTLELVLEATIDASSSFDNKGKLLIKFAFTLK